MWNRQDFNMSDQEDTSCQQFEDKMKWEIQKFLTDRTIVEILQAQIKATNVQTRNSWEGNRATTTLNEPSVFVHPQVNRGKGVLHSPVQADDDDEYYWAFKTP